MEIAALILSIVAILVAMYEIYHNARLNKTNIKTEYFSRLYHDILLEEIPTARKNIKIEDGSFVGYEKLQNLILDILEKSEFFKYADVRFYNKLKDKCIDLEDFLLNTANKKKIQISLPWEDLDKKIRKIYKYINKKHENG